MISLRISRRTGISGLAAGLALVVSSCGSLYQHYDEYLVRDQIHGSADAPAWVQNQIQSEVGALNFVGRGMAYNVLDERKAFDEAVMHAREQLAYYISTRVTAQVCDKDWARGARFLPLADAGPGDGETAKSSLEFQASQVADTLVGELLPVAQYWEQWDVEESPKRFFSGWWFENEERFDMRRYKCWVLTAIDKERVEALVERAAGMLEREAREQLALDKESVEAFHALQERVHYGRPFRLTTADNCAIVDSCVALDRSDWRHMATASADCDPCGTQAKVGY